MVQDENRRMHPVSEHYVKELQAGLNTGRNTETAFLISSRGKRSLSSSVCVEPERLADVEDPTASAPESRRFYGYAYRLETVPGNAKYLNGNQLFGIFRPSDKKITAANTLRKNQMSEEITFRKILTYRTPVQREKFQFIFCTNAWLMQFDLLDALCDLYPDTEIEIYIETGFHGKAYGIGNADESHIDFGAVAVVIPEKKKQDFPK